MKCHWLLDEQRKRIRWPHLRSRNSVEALAWAAKEGRPDAAATASWVAGSLDNPRHPGSEPSHSEVKKSAGLPIRIVSWSQRASMGCDCVQ